MFPHPFRRFMRSATSVPTGFLRFYVVKTIKERPMSGSEIMDALEKETNGRWKPSPGSIYPLLAWLQDNGYTKEVPTDGAGIKRYVLTEKGEQFFQEQIKLKEKLEEKLRFLTPPFLGGLFPEKLHPLVEPMRKLAKSLFDLRANMTENATDQAVKEVADLLDRTADKVEELNKKIKGEKSK